MTESGVTSIIMLDSNNYSLKGWIFKEDISQTYFMVICKKVHIISFVTLLIIQAEFILTFTYTEQTNNKKMFTDKIAALCCFV